MRYSREGTVILSEDDLTNPKEIRFKDADRETIEKDVIKEGGGQTQKIEKSTVDFELPMGKVAAGKWFFLYCDKEFTLKIDSGTARTMAAEKANEMWVGYTSLKISNPSATDDMRLTWAIGGE
jgi:hypothetical protein